MEVLSSTPDSFVENEQIFREQVSDVSLRERIPLVNVNEVYKLKEGGLVRFRGMIQDEHNPEFYISKYHVKDSITKSGKYRDGVDVEDGAPDTVTYEDMAQRWPYVVVSVPGINEWVEEVEERQFKITVDKSTSNMEEDISQPDVKKVCVRSKPPNDSFIKKCCIKVYDDNEVLKLNTTYEFVGFLNIEEEENIGFHIHSVHHEEIMHYNPLFKDHLMPDRMKYLRKELHIILTQLLLGDKLSAEYLILHLLSGVYKRLSILLLGKLSLNISNIPVMKNIDYPSVLSKFIEKLVPKSCYVPMTLENLNTLPFIPKKNYDTDCLVSGILQLSPNTHLILDETKLNTGKLNESGVKNLKAISTVIQDHSIIYDIPYCSIPFNCDVPALILSEGKSMLPFDIQVVLQRDQTWEETFQHVVEAAEHHLKSELLDELRVYLTSARTSKYRLTDDMEGMIQEEFVRLRQEGSFTAEDLHRLIELARLMSISFGKTCLDEEAWQMACELEKERKSRMGTDVEA